MGVKVTAASAALTGIVILSAWALGWPLERAVYLAPVLVVAVLAIAGLLVFWGKVAWAQLQDTGRPRLWLAVWVGGIALIGLLSLAGVELPRE